MYSLSLSPPKDKDVSTDVFDKAIDSTEKKLGLDGQPRLVIFHEKHGRRHAHCVWSRTNIETMTAVDIKHDHLKLKTLSKSIFLEQGWALPQGLRDYTKRSPFDFNREEWQAAARKDIDLKAVRESIHECWGISDSKASFEYALRECGYWLAKGDKKTILIILDIKGDSFPLRRQLKIKAQNIEARIGGAKDLPSINEAKEEIKKMLTPVFEKQFAQLRAQQEIHAAPLIQQKRDMIKTHQQQRTHQKELQESRWSTKEHKRQSRVHSGLQPTLDKINKRYWKVRKLNEKETWSCLNRDQEQRDLLISQQLDERQAIQEDIDKLRVLHAHERQDFIKGFSENQFMKEELENLLSQKILHEQQFYADQEFQLSDENEIDF